jgi:hypothetical protein
LRNLLSAFNADRSVTAVHPLAIPMSQFHRALKAYRGRDGKVQRNLTRRYTYMVRSGQLAALPAGKRCSPLKKN